MKIVVVLDTAQTMGGEFPARWHFFLPGDSAMQFPFPTDYLFYKTQEEANMVAAEDAAKYMAAKYPGFEIEHRQA